MHIAVPLALINVAKLVAHGFFVQHVHFRNVSP